MVSKVLLLDQFGDIGGGQRILIDLVEGAPGMTFTALCPRGPLTSELRKLGADVVEMSIPVMRDGGKLPLDFFRAFLHARGVAREHLALATDTDVIVVNGMRALAAGRLLQQASGKPMVLYLHLALRGIERSIVRAALRKGRTVAIAPSQIVADSIGLPGSVSIIPNWVSPEYISAEVNRVKLREYYGIRSGLPVILVPGRLSKRKGQLLVLDAYLQHFSGRVEIVFAGDALFEESGKDIEKALKRATRRDSGIHHRSWKGSTLAHAYDGAALVVVPSLWEEPFGLTAIEAMSRGVPVVVTDRGELPRIADEGRFGEVVPPTPEGIANAVSDFLLDHKRWQNRADRAREHVLAEYHPDTNRKRVYDLWNTMVHEH